MTTENTFSFFEVQIRLVVTKFDAMYHGICSVNILVKHYFLLHFKFLFLADVKIYIM